MATIAKFSNGFEDEYKGNRDVKAAWMITRKSDGEVLYSGHSLDSARAQKTAENNATYIAHEVGVEDYKLDLPSRFGTQAYMIKTARKLGFTGKSHQYAAFARQHNAARKAKIMDRVTIEVINI